jgi:SMI1 / KNR4 family (SUKH-1)
MSGPRRVVLRGIETPVFVERCGPPAAEADLAAFESKLGAPLPAQYRDFLATYNGGDPVCGEVTGRDDDPGVPYWHGDAIRTFLQLPTAAFTPATYRALRAPSDHPWSLPADALVIADDSGGNAFVLSLTTGEVHFVDHEALERPIGERVMAADFLDFLQRFMSVEERARLDEEERAAEREGIEHGPLPARAEEQCAALAERYPRVRDGVRAAFLAVFDQKGFFAVHADPASREVLDVLLWMAVHTTHPGGVPAAKLAPSLIDPWLRRWHGLGFAGYAPAFIDDWWRVRADEGAVVTRDGLGTLTEGASRAIAAKWFGPMAPPGGTDTTSTP